MYVNSAYFNSIVPFFEATDFLYDFLDRLPSLLIHDFVFELARISIDADATCSHQRVLLNLYEVSTLHIYDCLFAANALVSRTYVEG